MPAALPGLMRSGQRAVITDFLGGRTVVTLLAVFGPCWRFSGISARTAQGEVTVLWRRPVVRYRVGLGR